MRKMKNIAILFIITSLCLNIILLNKINGLSGEMRAIHNNYSQIQATMHSVTSQVNNMMNDMRKEQRWITPAQVNINEANIKDEEALVNLSWQIKDYHEESKTTFYYRQASGDDFQAMPVTSKGGGFFEVDVPLEFKAEPFWDIQVSMRGSPVGESTATIAEKNVQETRSGYSISYYISVERQGNIRTSEIEYLNLDKLAYMSYEPLMVHVDISNKTHNVSVIDRSLARVKLTSSVLKVYNGDTLVAEKPLEVKKEKRGSAAVYHVVYEAGEQQFNRLVLSVRYDNGKEFARVIFTS